MQIHFARSVFTSGIVGLVPILVIPVFLPVTDCCFMKNSNLEFIEENLQDLKTVNMEEWPKTALSFSIQEASTSCYIYITECFF